MGSNLNKISSLFSHVGDVILFKSIRRGLTLTIPILLIGSFCIILLNLPISPYQDFITSIPLLISFLLSIHAITFGAFSLYVAISISLSYAQIYAEKHGDFFVQGAPFAALGAYLLLVGLGSEDFSVAVFSTQSLFIAIVSSLGASALYCSIMHRPGRYRRLYGNATDTLFNRALASIFPIVIVVLLAAVVNMAVSLTFGVSSVDELFFRGVSSFFPSDTSSLSSGLLYLFLNNVMWFFGIHGGNMLAGVATNVFVPGTALNAELIASGAEPSAVITKTFLDTFASIGGAGALFSLLLAVLFFGRHRNMKRLSRLGAAPVLFNINEIMLFGLPVIWNPFFLIPLLVVPLVNLVIAYGATIAGLVPYVTVDVSWITPPFIGGYLATQSYAGAILQLVNIVVGMLIYLPFLRIFEKSLKRTEKNEFEGLLSRFKQSELERDRLLLTTLPGTIGHLVRALSEDLRRAIDEGTFDLYYQPQFNIDDDAVGAEALLRWNHPVHGMMYPPLVVGLAEETGLINKLERKVLLRGLDAAKEVQDLALEGKLWPTFSISVNATSRALQNEDFINEVIEGVKKRGLDPGRLIIEATEHEALHMTEDTTGLLRRLTDAGIPLAIDDFSMGQTSFKYLETSSFSIVKLDGGIARGVMGNARSAEIVASITKLSQQLSFKVLSEYVETSEQRDQLKELGCLYFQGYLYSPAVPFKDMITLVQKEKPGS